MNSGLSRILSLFTLAAVSAVAGISGQAAAAEKQAGRIVTLLAGPAGPETFIRPATPTGPQPEAASFIVSYSGFSPAAKSAFQRAVRLWSSRITSSVPITISARYTPLGTGILGSAGPNLIHRNFPGALVANTWYVDSLANKLRGAQLDASADIVANFSSNFPNWHFGSGPAPAGKYDFTTVVLHEIGHGLAFLAERA